MKHCIFLFFLGLVNCFFAQTKKEIDSLNHLEYNVILQNKTTLQKRFLQNIENSKKINYKLGEAESYSKLSTIAYFNGNYKDNLNYSLKAIKLFDKLNEKDLLAREYGELGFRMKDRDIKKANSYMQKAIKIAEQNKLQKPLTSIYNNYGTLQKNLQKTDSALYYFNKCLTIKQQLNDQTGIPYSLNNIAEVLIEKNQFAEAKKLIDEGLIIRNSLKDTYGISDSYAYLGDLFLAKNEFQNAINNYNKSLQIAQKNNFTNLIRHNFKMLSVCYEKLNNTDLAFTYFKKFTSYKDSILNTETNTKIAELEIQFETEKKQNELIKKEAEVKEKNNTITILAITAIGVMLICFLIYKNQKAKISQQKQAFALKEALTEVETQNKLQDQRLAISKDLHDNIGAQLTFIISSVETAQYITGVANTKIGDKLTSITNFAKETIVELRDTIWAMNAEQLQFEDLKTRIFNFIEKAKLAKEEVQFSFDIDANVKNKKMSSLVAMNVYRTIQEAVNNTLKYATATEIKIQITQQNKQFLVTVNDNGKGFDSQTIEKGNGLQNMQKRIESIGGNFQLQSEIGKGTQIKFTF
jgi:signal transduction histidine kinase